jgi:hypothetical protein
LYRGYKIYKFFVPIEFRRNTKMPLCGFNKKMLDGLVSFHEGLVEHGIVDRSRKKNVSTDEILKRELLDMENFLSEIDLIENPIKRELIRNLTTYASKFYELVQQEGVENTGEIVGGLTKLYREMDRKYYSELEGKPDAMRKLANYLNEL